MGTDIYGIRVRNALAKQAERLKNVVVFRIVVFRPFTSEVIVAKVKSSDEDGIRRASVAFLHSRNNLTIFFFFFTPSVTVGFFDDIYIPSTYLPQPSALFVPSGTFLAFLC